MEGAALHAARVAAHKVAHHDALYIACRHEGHHAAPPLSIMSSMGPMRMLFYHGGGGSPNPRK